MPVDQKEYQDIVKALAEKNVSLVAVSKSKPVDDIKGLYDLGQRDFGENYVQELNDKAAQLPKDIRWHFIGHLQSNKVKQIAPFVHLIHSVDSLKILQEINKQALRNNRIIDCLLQMHIAEEETKFGLDTHELSVIMANVRESSLANIRVIGLMGMASFTDDINKVRKEFRYLKEVFDGSYGQDSNDGHSVGQLQTLSMGMSSDYLVAIEEGSNMVRIGSLLFGNRE